jgi:hypothetical protein
MKYETINKQFLNNQKLPIMKKTIFTVITVATVIMFTACSKNVEHPSGNTVSSVQTGNTSHAIKKTGVCCIIIDSTTTKINP